MGYSPWGHEEGDTTDGLSKLSASHQEELKFRTTREGRDCVFTVIAPSNVPVNVLTTGSWRREF